MRPCSKQPQVQQAACTSGSREAAVCVGAHSYINVPVSRPNSQVAYSRQNPGRIVSQVFNPPDMGDRIGSINPGYLLLHGITRNNRRARAADVITALVGDCGLLCTVLIYFIDLGRIKEACERKQTCFCHPMACPVCPSVTIAPPWQDMGPHTLAGQQRARGQVQCVQVQVFVVVIMLGARGPPERREGERSIHIISTAPPCQPLHCCTYPHGRAQAGPIPQRMVRHTPTWPASHEGYALCWCLPGPAIYSVLREW